MAKIKKEPTSDDDDPFIVISLSDWPTYGAKLRRKKICRQRDSFGPDFNMRPPVCGPASGRYVTKKAAPKGAASQTGRKS